MRKTTYFLGMVLAVGVVSAWAGSGTAVYAADVTSVTDEVTIDIEGYCGFSIENNDHTITAVNGAF